MQAEPVHGAPRLAGRRVLLVDDEVSGAEVLALFLAEEGLHVTVASGARQALERLDQAAPDLLITDFMMPGTHGADLVAAVRAREGYAELPVLFISGAPESAVSSRGVRYDGFLRKPFDAQRLIEAVAAVFDRPADATARPSA